MAGLRIVLSAVVVIATTMAAGCVGGIALPRGKAELLFIGDYSTGDFSQWPSVQNRDYNGSGARYVPSYPATVVSDPVKGHAARFEVRSGDWSGFAGGERSDVGSNSGDTGGREGQTRWYAFSTMFDPSFPRNHAELGWGVTNGWHPNSSRGSAAFEWSVGTRSGYWTLDIEEQNSPGDYRDSRTVFETPLAVGTWHDIKMEVNWSTDPTQGWIRLWHNGSRQAFADGSDTYFLSTLVPGTTTCYYKEGYYRQAARPTGIVYHTGFRAAADEGGL
ncbi:polysaccharide lyase [Mycobacterium sp. pV006]|uniref:polysaccharide lyase n=1 Tax=Mycobacterium sp. pV006 TaxID=3238983 RepID=UPI00351AF7F2